MKKYLLSFVSYSRGIQLNTYDSLEEVLSRNPDCYMFNTRTDRWEPCYGFHIYCMDLTSPEYPEIWEVSSQALETCLEDMGIFPPLEKETTDHGTPEKEDKGIEEDWIPVTINGFVVKVTRGTTVGDLLTAGFLGTPIELRP